MADLLPSDAAEMLARRFHRFHHHTWHSVRNVWYKMTAEERSKVERLGWAPNSGRGSWYFPAWQKERRTARVAVANGSGEDFFYFHRQMVMMVLESMGSRKLVAWGNPPSPGSGEPVPAPWVVPPDDKDLGSVDEAQTRALASIKSDSFYFLELAPLNRQFTDPSYLQTVSLGELGARIEWSIHNHMHIRWSAMPWNPFTKQRERYGRQDTDGSVDLAWDNVLNDDLNDDYSAPVNAIFWMLHQWVDDRVNDWIEANVTRARPAKLGNVDWVEYDGMVSDPWTGPFGADMHSADTNNTGQRKSAKIDAAKPGGKGQAQLLSDMEEVCKIVIPIQQRSDSSVGVSGPSAKSSTLAWRLYRTFA